MFSRYGDEFLYFLHLKYRELKSSQAFPSLLLIPAVRNW